MDKKTVIFLDRDGTINRKAGPHSYVTKWEDFKLLPGVAEAIRLCNEHGWPVAVITNQRCVARGLSTLTQIEALHERLNLELEKDGAHIDAFFICPHAAGECTCRKPDAGLFYKAEEWLQNRGISVDKDRSYMIGDAASDMAAGKKYGIRTVYLNETVPEEKITDADLICKDLHEAVLSIIDKGEQNGL